MSVHLKTLRAVLVALSCLISACASTPEDEIADEIKKEPAEWIAQADNNRSNGQFTQARQQYQQALAQEPDNLDARQGLAKTETALGNYDAALKEWNAVLEKQPDHNEAYIGKATLLVRAGKLLEAREMLEAVSTRQPDDWRVWNTLGVILDLQQDYTRAREHYSTALAKNNRQPEIYNNLGYSQIMTRAYDEAIATLRQGLQYQPDSEHMQSNLAIAHAWKGEYDKARELFLLQMDEAEAYNNVGYIAMLRNDYAMAEKLFQSAIDKSPNFYRKAYENLEKLRKRQGNTTDPTLP